jgi:hypothetical protein
MEYLFILKSAAGQSGTEVRGAVIYSHSFVTDLCMSATNRLLPCDRLCNGGHSPFAFHMGLGDRLDDLCMQTAAAACKFMLRIRFALCLYASPLICSQSILCLSNWLSF